LSADLGKPEPNNEVIRQRLQATVDEHRVDGFRVERSGESVAVLSKSLGADWVERLEILIDEVGAVERYRIRGRGAEVDASPLDPGIAFQLGDEVVVRDYPGRSQRDASQLYARESQWAAMCGYKPVAHTWAEGRPGIGRIVALGLFSAVAKPEGVLTVTYRIDPEALENAGRSKVCPDCAETVKAEARICRFCRYQFEPR
jgi:hypothetical protein